MILMNAGCRAEPLSDDLTASARRAEPASPVNLDLAHLRTYTMGDLDLEREILALFLAELPKSIAALKAAQNAKDWHMATHTLKGSALSIGAGRLAAASAAAERLGWVQEPDRASAILSIAAAVGDVSAEVARQG